jgi:hypothetical protein
VHLASSRALLEKARAIFLANSITRMLHGRSSSRRYRTTVTGACQNALFWLVGSSTVTWQM